MTLTQELGVRQARVQETGDGGVWRGLVVTRLGLGLGRGGLVVTRLGLRLDRGGLVVTRFLKMSS